MSSPFCPIPEALAELKAGHMIVLVDDERRENEGDLVCAAEKITPEIVNFMVKHARGLLCVAMPPCKRCRMLELQPQTPDNTATLQTAFTVTIDAHPRLGVSTGVSATDRATTSGISRPGPMADDFTRPGHINPLWPAKAACWSRGADGGHG